VFAAAVEKWPDRWIERTGLAQARLELGRPADALPEIERARALAPRDAEVLYLYGWTLRDLGRTAEARAALTEALRVEPKHGAARRALDALAGSP
jgi:Flp pilus assembly protein TadD